MRGYKEEGTTTTPFDMVMLNDLDRFHLVIDVIDRVPGLAARVAGLRQHMSDERLRYRTWTREHGDDHPEVRATGPGQPARRVPAKCVVVLASDDLGHELAEIAAFLISSTAPTADANRENETWTPSAATKNEGPLTAMADIEGGSPSSGQWTRCSISLPMNAMYRDTTHGCRAQVQVFYGPFGAGMQFRAETATRRGSAEMTIEITRYERPRRLESSTRLSNMDIEGALTFDPVPEGTRIQWVWDVRPRGALRLMGPIISRMGAAASSEPSARTSNAFSKREKKQPSSSSYSGFCGPDRGLEAVRGRRS